MSSRWYPIYQKGNPQLRVFLPNFWMKMVKPRFDNYPKNHLKFIVSNGMSKYDVQNYLEKIYNIPVVDVRVSNYAGKTRLVEGKNYVVKDDDFKVAWVTMPKDTKFDFPELFPRDKVDKDLEDEKRNQESLQEHRKKFLGKLTYKPDVPGWFS